MLFDEENGYSLEYIYENYFERASSLKRTPEVEKDEEKNAEKEEQGGSLGLRELIGGGNSIGGLILHRNMNSGSKSGNIESLKPNSGQAVTIGEHHICIVFHEDTGSDYRVCEWHGHIMLFDEDNGYSLEYIYGNYFERASSLKRTSEVEKDEEKNAEKEEQGGSLGLRELIGGGNSICSLILHRNMNSGSMR
ncbi:hypothetical protein NE237_005176 [Protea cynaroides]|uniref:Uncharacterized protein n=1 Tax=Protea cynaroides TaxID=273540 RepID=A0A9Q0KK89_9MAGN|nr:hypothetical protein NE237_005176 [Protea cynaroides]